MRQGGHLKRKLFTLCSAVSLLLCVAVVTLWIRSYSTSDSLLLYGADVGVCDRTAECFRGVVRIAWFADVSAVNDGRPRLLLWSHPADEQTEEFFTGWFPVQSVLGFGYKETPSLPAFPGSASNSAAWKAIQFPLWFPALITALLPTMKALQAALHRRHRRSGKCPACGYDLRASPDRCPECGRPGSPVSSPT